MTSEMESKVVCKTFDPTPVALRSAVRRNSQMSRQLSKVRNSLTTEERETQQIINKENLKLAAKLKQLKTRSHSAERSVKNPNQNNNDDDHIHRKSDKESPAKTLENRSKMQRKMFYRQESISTLVVQIESEEPTLLESVETVAGKVQQPSPELTKYQIPSYQRAELIKKQKEEEDKNNKIYGKKRT